MTRAARCLIAVLALAASAPGCGGDTTLPAADVKRLDLVINEPDAADAGPDSHGDAFHRDVGADGLPTDPGPDLVPDPGPPDVPPDLPPDVPLDLPPDPGPPDVPPVDAGCRVEGDPCDDGDLCTVNDQCVSGACRGTPISCPDDDLPCTRASCAAGLCGQEVVSGTCLIKDTCWSAGQPDPGYGCRGCDPAKDPKGWTLLDGTACDDGDPCTGPDACAAGTCKAGPWTCEGTPCRYHTDCYPDRWCGLWYKADRTMCSAPCRGAADCQAGEACTPVPGSANQGYCQPAPGTGLDGAPCDTGWDCATGLCMDSACTPSCAAEAGCPAQTTCSGVGLPTLFMNGACVPDGSGGLSNGALCTADGYEWDAKLCRSGHCDLVLTDAPCAPLCSTDADCGAGQECNLILHTVQAVSDTVGYDPQFAAATHDALLGCYTRESAGYKGLGVPCNAPSECTSGKCMGLVPNEPTMFCTTWCSRDADCPATMACKTEVSNLVSPWLNSGLGQASNPNAYTLVKVCKPR